MESPAKPPLLGALAKSPTSPGFRQLGQRWRLSRCGWRARAERAYDRTSAYVPPLRRSTRRYSSQRDKFHHQFALLVAARQVPPSVRTARRSATSSPMNSRQNPIPGDIGQE